MTNKQPSANTSTGHNSRVLLPDQWERVPLREVVSIEYGEGLTESERDPEGEVPVYGSSGVVGHHSQALVDGPCIIVGRKGSSGAVHYSRDACWPIDTTYHIQPPDEITSLYLYYGLKSLGLGSLDKSTTIPSLRRDDFYGQPIPIAPLPEQRRIVDAIETQFTRLDAAVAALERAQANLENYRASVLQAACEGRLVATEAELARREGRDYEPADELLERIMEERRAKWEEERWAYEIERAKKKAAQAERKAAGLPYYIRELEPEHWEDRTPEEYEPYLPKDDKWKERYDEPKPPDTEDLPELPEGWVYASLDQLSSHVTSGSRGWAKYYSDAGSLFVRVGNLNRADVEVDLDDVVFVDAPAGAEAERTRLQLDDWLISITADVGMIGVVQERVLQWGKAFINQHIGLVRPVEAETARFIAIVLSAEPSQAQFRDKQYGATKKGLNLADLKSTVVAVPSIAEQGRIVEEVDRRFSLINALEKSVETNLARAKRLRQAILKKAFEGRLVPQDPTDEPASVLLEQIQNGRGNGEGKTPEQMPLL